ncbi:rasC [Acrasis kona]|uniref:RasC n=1 Tax=Acrasis kona TaxID=1008807 RepID=A0AAW2Z7E0_9EUKA
MQNEDIIRIIALYIGPCVKETYKLSTVNKQFQEIFNSDFVWSYIWKNKYPMQQNVLNGNFKFCYHQMYLFQKTSPHRKDVNKDIKVVVTGGGGVGKSALVIRYVSGQFIYEYDPTIEDSYRKMVRVGDKDVILDILGMFTHEAFFHISIDTAGPEEYSAMRDAYLRHADYTILCYDCTSRRTLVELHDFYDQVQRINKISKKTPAKLLVVECKRDADVSDATCIPQQEGIDLARSFNAIFITTSAKSNINVEKAFQTIAEDGLMIDPNIIETLNKGECIVSSDTKMPKTKKNKCLIM